MKLTLSPVVVIRLQLTLLIFTLISTEAFLVHVYQQLPETTTDPTESTTRSFEEYKYLPAGGMYGFRKFSHSNRESDPWYETVIVHPGLNP